MKQILAAIFLAATLSTSALADSCSKEDSVAGIPAFAESVGATSTDIISDKTVIINIFALLVPILGEPPFSTNDVSVVAFVSKDGNHGMLIYDTNSCLLASAKLSDKTFNSLFIKADGS